MDPDLAISGDLFMATDSGAPLGGFYLQPGSATSRKPSGSPRSLTQLKVSLIQAGW